MRGKGQRSREGRADGRRHLPLTQDMVSLADGQRASFLGEPAGVTLRGPAQTRRPRAGVLHPHLSFPPTPTRALSDTETQRGRKQRGGAGDSGAPLPARSWEHRRRSCEHRANTAHVSHRPAPCSPYPAPPVTFTRAPWLGTAMSLLKKQTDPRPHARPHDRKQTCQGLKSGQPAWKLPLCVRAVSRTPTGCRGFLSGGNQSSGPAFPTLQGSPAHAGLRALRRGLSRLVSQSASGSAQRQAKPFPTAGPMTTGCTRKMRIEIRPLSPQSLLHSFSRYLRGPAVLKLGWTSGFQRKQQSCLQGMCSPIA